MIILYSVTKPQLIYIIVTGLEKTHIQDTLRFSLLDSSWLFTLTTCNS